MADHLASIFGTEKDRVNCPFYFKIGSCRHGDRCSRMHNRPTISQSILLQNMYQNPVINAPLGPDGYPIKVDERKAQQEFEDFYEDVFEELAQFGELENVNVCDNLADHMVGNVYVKFREEEAAAAAVAALQGRFYNGRPIIIEFSPVTDFREATCRQYEENTCNRGGYCNFMHLKPISKELRKKLFGRYKRTEERSRSPRRDDKRGGERRRSRSRDRDHRRDDRRDDRGRDYRGGPGGYDRGRRDDRGGGHGGRSQRENSEERRAKIASWNSQRDAGGAADAGAAGGGGGGGGYTAPSSYPSAGGYGSAPPPGPGGYGSAGYAGGAQSGAYGAPPPQQSQPYGAPPGAPPPQQQYGAPPPQQPAGGYSYNAYPPPQGTGGDAGCDLIQGVLLAEFASGPVIP
ncbi:hypothetical protein QJQ45_019766, partial [Haematococcus lacustris]